MRWFRNRFAFAWFWSLVFIVLLAASSGVFMLLPKQFLNPVNDTQNAVLPIRASDDIELPDVGPGTRSSRGGAAGDAINGISRS